MLSRIFAQLLNLAHRNNSELDIAPLEGRSFVLSIDELPQDIAIVVQNNTITSLPEEHIPEADVIISGNIKAILAMIQDTDDGLESDELYIAGKINTAKRFQTFLGSLSVNWENFLNQFLPDDMAQKGAAAIEQGLHFAKGSVEQLNQHLQHYLIHEKKILVTQSELHELKQSIKTLNQRLDNCFNKLSSMPVTAVTCDADD